MKRRLGLLVLVATLAAIAHPAFEHLRAASLLLRFGDPKATGFVADFDRHDVTETSFDVALSHGTTRARLYAPVGVAHAPGIVLLHGVHYLGIDEPRLVRFARTIAATGVAVLTPEIREIADYRIDAASLETISAAVGALRSRIDAPTVGVMGLSFAGGLALVAASEAPYSNGIGFVVAVGAHDDLPRVLRFFASNTIELPDGTTKPMQAHAYGPLVLVYSRVADLFPAEDVAGAREALRSWLGERFDEARARAATLTPPSRALLATCFSHDVAPLAPTLLAEVGEAAETMRAVSPHDHLADIRVPVFLLHGEGDNVIPYSETLWLAHDTPPRYLREALVSAAIQHVEIHGEPTAKERWELVDFMANVLAEASARP
jgi:dienelactone hydrolase